MADWLPSFGDEKPEQRGDSMDEDDAVSDGTGEGGESEEEEEEDDDEDVAHLREENESLRRRLRRLEKLMEVPSSIAERPILQVQYQNLDVPLRRYIDSALQKARVHPRAPPPKALAPVYVYQKPEAAATTGGSDSSSGKAQEGEEPEEGEVSSDDEEQGTQADEAAGDNKEDEALPPLRSLVTYYETFCIDRQGVPDLVPGITRAGEIEAFDVPLYEEACNAVALPLRPARKRGGGDNSKQKASDPTAPDSPKAKPRAPTKHSTKERLMATLGVCFNCGDERHSVRECRKPRDEAAIRLNSSRFRQFRESTQSKNPKPRRYQGRFHEDILQTTASATGETAEEANARLRKEKVSSGMSVIEDVNSAEARERESKRARVAASRDTRDDRGDSRYGGGGRSDRSSGRDYPDRQYSRDDRGGRGDRNGSSGSSSRAGGRDDFSSFRERMSSQYRGRGGRDSGRDSRDRRGGREMTYGQPTPPIPIPIPAPQHQPYQQAYRHQQPAHYQPPHYQQQQPYHPPPPPPPPAQAINPYAPPPHQQQRHPPAPFWQQQQQQQQQQRRY